MTHVRLLVPVTSTAIRKVEQLDALARPGLEISAAFITAGPPSIESRVDEVFCAPGMIALAQQAERDGVDALVIDCMGDPALGPVREAVSIPVLGVAQTCMAMATTLAHRFGVVTVLDRTSVLVEDLVRLYGFDRHFVGTRSVGVPVLQIHDDTDKLQADLAAAALHLVKVQGAGAVILGCTGFFGCAEAIRRVLADHGLAVPVFDPVPTTVPIAAALAGNGLSHSRISYPAMDWSKPIVGFDQILATA